MKKYAIVLLLAILASVICLSACSYDETYVLLNDIAKEKYSEVTLEISAKDEVELKAEFKSVKNGAQTTVTYSYENIAKIEEVDGEYVLPQDYIVTKQGVAIVKDDKIVSCDGDEISVPLEQLSSKCFAFDPSYFDDVKFTSNTFSASVTKPRAFMNDDDLRSLNMKVVIEYVENGDYYEKNGSMLTVKTGSFLKSIHVTYTTLEGVDVTLDYTFKK